MKSNAQRKLTRFFVINPVGDRRQEKRFESREEVFVRFCETGAMAPAVAVDVGKAGLRLEIEADVQVGDEIEVAFPNGTDQIRCFGRVAWVKSGADKKQLAGLAIDAWHGVILGEASWSRHKGTVPRKDRRDRPR